MVGVFFFILGSGVAGNGRDGMDWIEMEERLWGGRSIFSLR